MLANIDIGCNIALFWFVLLFIRGFPFLLVAGVFLDVLVMHSGFPIAKWQRSSWRIIVHLDPPENTAQKLKEIPRKSCLTLIRIWKVWRYCHKLKRQLDGFRTGDDNSPAVPGLFAVQSKEKYIGIKAIIGRQKQHLTISDG